MLNLTIVATSLLALAPLSDTDLFGVLDHNGDGVVTADEVSEAQRPHFQRALRVADSNSDGALTRLELNAALTDLPPADAPAPRTGAGFRPGAQMNITPEQLDRNKDGLLSPNEVPAALRERYQQALDQFGQPALPIRLVQQLVTGGRPSEAQIEAAREEMMKDKDAEDRKQAMEREAGVQRQRAQPRPGTADGAPANGSSVSAEAVFRRLDRNGDGRLSRPEIPVRMKQNLQRIDANNDGSISRSEFEQALRSQMRRPGSN